MQSNNGINLSDVQSVYNGPEGDLWKLIMGQQIHIGGLTSSIDLAEKARIGKGTKGIDLCCCNGAGMRFLIRFCGVAHMRGVDATEKVVTSGKELCRQEGYNGEFDFVVADVCDSGIEGESADFVWGEDAWCYVVDKPKLISESARLVKTGGTIAFTDWVFGENEPTQEEAQRFMKFMKFPNVETAGGYRELLEQNGCEVTLAQDTGRFTSYVELYINMLQMQLTYDALKIIGFDMDMMQAMAGEMQFMQELAKQGKIAQGIFVARKK